MPSHYHERTLPHWQPEGAALFLTWRLHGSLPRKINFLAPEADTGKRFAEMDRILNRAATGPRWLKEDHVARVVLETLHYGEQQLHLYSLRAWVIMPNHIHILIDPNAELPRITKSIKNYSARQANAILGRNGPFWQDESYDRWVRERSQREKVVIYIEWNPVAAGLVERPEEFRWSSGWTGQEACPTKTKTKAKAELICEI